MFKKWIKEYVSVNKSEIMQVISCILIGIVIGTVLFIFSSNNIKELAVNTASEVFNISKGETYIKTNIILNGIKSNILLIGILALLSMTLFGRTGILAVMVIKGMAMSIYTILLFKLFGLWWGIVATFLLVLLVNIIYMPALIYISTKFLEVNFNIFKAKISSVNGTGIPNLIFSVIASLLFMFSSTVVEQIVSPIILNIYSKL